MFPYMNLDDDAFELEFLRNLNEKEIKNLVLLN